jgi:major vault protein
MKKDRGLHVRAVKAFEAKAGDQIPAGVYKPGQEIFLQDQEGFFFPTDALDVIGEVHAIPLADKEGIYVRHIATGRIQTVVGPKNFLPDPTQVEVVARPLEPDVVWRYGMSSHDPMRAVTVYIPPSLAVLVTARSKREVVRGPQVRILDYDEDLEVLTLSTGKPKSDETLLSTCFLLTEGNKVSDIVRVRTSDHVELDVAVSYRVSFQASDAAGEARWFNVKNYVALLCDHVGSIVRAAVRATSIDLFHAQSAGIIRSAVLGEKKGDEKRSGRSFDENGMVVYDVEVLGVKILDEDVDALLSDAQRSAIRSEVSRKQQELRLADERIRESVNRGIYEAQAASLTTEVTLEGAKHALALATAAGAVDVDKMTRLGEARNAADALEIESAAAHAAFAREGELERARLTAQVAAFKEQMSALAPELIATLKMLGNQKAATELTKNLAPLAILGGESVADVAERLLRGLPLGAAGEQALARLVTRARPVSEEP